MRLEGAEWRHFATKKSINAVRTTSWVAMSSRSRLAVVRTLRSLWRLPLLMTHYRVNEILFYLRNHPFRRTVSQLLFDEEQQS